MSQDDPHSTISDLLSRGKLDEALEALSEADSRGQRPGNDVLIPLARALLEAGRNQESLQLLELASVSAAFGGDLDQITTRVGMPTGDLMRTPSGGVVLEPDTDLGGPTTDEVSELYTDRGAETRDSKDTDPFIDDQTIAEAKDADTDEVPLLEAAPTIDTRPNSMPEASLAKDTRRDLGSPSALKAFGAPHDTVADRPAAELAKTEKIEFSQQSTIRFDVVDDESDGEAFVDGPTSFYGIGEATRGPAYEVPSSVDVTTRIATDDESLQHDSSPREEEGRDTWTKPLDMTAILATNPSIGETAAEVDQLRRSVIDSTSKVSLPEHAVEDERVSPHEESEPTTTLSEAESDLEHILARITPVTSKLHIQDIEVVGSFVSGVGTSSPFQSPRDVEPAVGSTTEGHESVHLSLEGGSPAEATDRIHLPSPVKAVVLAPRQLLRIGVAILVIAVSITGVVLLYSTQRQREQVQELERVSELLIDDTYASHLHTLAVLSDLSSRYSDGPACAEFAAESAQMWGRFGQNATHRDEARRSLDDCPRNGAEEARMLAQARLLLYSGDISSSHVVAREAVNSFPQSARLRTVLAQTLEEQGDDDLAVEELEVARMIDPRSIPAALLLARLHRRAGRLEQARMLLEQVQRQSARHVEANAEGLMLELDALGNHARRPALAKLTTISSGLEADVQGQPPAIAAYVALARGRLALALDDVDRGGILLNQARHLGLRSAEAKQHISKGLRMSGDLASALEVSEGAQRHGVAMLLERVRVLVAVGRPEEAMRELRTLDERYSADRSNSSDDLGSTRVRLEATALRQLGNTPEAQSRLDRLLAKRDDPLSLLFLAEVLIDRGRRIDAKAALAKVSTPPWKACAEAGQMELRGELQQALATLEKGGAPRERCTLRLKALFARRSGQLISEISELRVLLRVDPLARDRVALVRAVWRERGAHAAIAELRPILAAPPTGLRPLLDVIDLLASMNADSEATLLLEGATRAGARPETLATARARYERSRGRPQSALQTLEKTSGEGAPPVTSLEHAATLLDLGRPVEAEKVLKVINAEPCSPLWVDQLKLNSMLDVETDSFFATDKLLSVALLECADIGSVAAEQELALWRVELSINAKIPLIQIQSMLRTVPPWPPSPMTPYLRGRLKELEGNVEAARIAYSEALKLDEAHIPSLIRLVELEQGPTLRRRLDELTQSPESPSTAGQRRLGSVER